MTVLNKFSENRKRVLSNSFEFKITLMPKQYEILQKKKHYSPQCPYENKCHNPDKILIN